MTEQSAAERVLEPRTDMDARTPLPRWLAGRSSRRAVASVPPLALLACGLLTATRPDDTLGTVLLGVTAVLAVAGILLLRRASALLGAGGRDVAHRQAHGLTIGLLTLVTLVAIADGLLSRSSGTALIPGDNWIQVLVTTTLVAGMIPAAVLVWRRTGDHRGVPG